jgi:single-stranded-DNA-specific exonuclease
MLDGQPLGSAIVIGRENWHPGVIGIVASRLVERYNCPAILLSIDGEVAKGSCRSIPPVNMYESLGACSNQLIQFGGHAQAAGLTLKTENIPAFRESFQKAVTEALHGQVYIPRVEPDYFVPPEQEITTDSVRELFLLEPCGQGNPSPLLAFKDAEILSAGVMGKERNHLWLSLRHGGVKYKGVSWNAGNLVHNFYPHEKATLAFAPKLNYFQDKENVDLLVSAVSTKHQIIDYRISSLSKEELLKNILQKGGKTVVYLGNTSSLKQNDPNCLCQNIENKNIPEDVSNVVLYDGSCAGLWQDKDFFLTGRTNVTLYLLYRREDFLDMRHELTLQYTDAQGMRSCYKLLHGALNKGCHDVKEILSLKTPEGIVLTEQILKVFQELDFIQRENGMVSLKSQDFNPLVNSPTYSQMLEEYGEKVRELNRALEITSAEIAALWK